MTKDEAMAAKLREVAACLIRTYDHAPDSCNVVSILSAATRLEALQAQPVGEARVCVPREPTDAMLEAGEDARIANTDRYLDGSEVAGDVVPAIWRAMLESIQ